MSIRKVKSDALRISPNYSSNDWLALDCQNEGDCVNAVGILRDRLTGRFLKFTDMCLPDPHSGFVILALDCLLAETIEQFRAGIIDGRGKSEKLIKSFLERPSFQPDFDKDARAHFYADIRCGLLHQAEAKEMWLVRRGGEKMLEKAATGRGYIIDVKIFHEAMHRSVTEYFDELLDPENATLRKNLWEKMDSISNVREKRGLAYDHEDFNE